jgi:hypothetical protein
MPLLILREIPLKENNRPLFQDCQIGGMARKPSTAEYKRGPDHHQTFFQEISPDSPVEEPYLFNYGGFTKSSRPAGCH